MTRAPAIPVATIRQARERCHATGEIAAALRPPIRRSWARSLAGAVPREPAFRFESEIDLDGRLCRSAGPVFDRLAARLAGTATSLFLANEQAVLLRRFSDTADLGRRLDRACSVPGAVLAEGLVGTNGVGTVAQTGEALAVCGPEHWAEGYQDLACAGAPIRNRVTGRIEGVLTVTAPSRADHPALLALVSEAASDIETELVVTASHRERALLESFLTATRRSNRAILAASGRLVITTPAAARVLERVDQSQLWEAIAGAEESGRTDAVVLDDGGAAIEVRLRPQGAAGAGVVAEFRVDVATGTPRRPAPPGLAGWVGDHPSVRDAARAARMAVRQRRGLVVAGAPGTGRLALVRAAFAEQGTDVVVADAALAPVDGPAAWMQAVREALAGPAPVVLRHVELLDGRTARAVAALLDDRPRAALALTVTGDPRDMAPAVRSLATRVASRPIGLVELRHRPDDVPALVAHVASGRRRFGSDALQVLRRHDWPDNVRELRRLVEDLCADGGGDVRAADLPAWLRTRSARRRMTRIEEVEMSALLAALQEAGGNKTRAAELLGVSRSTVYRKLLAGGVALDARTW